MSTINSGSIAISAEDKNINSKESDHHETNEKNIIKGTNIPENINKSLTPILL